MESITGEVTLASELDKLMGAETETFTVNDNISADWALRKVGEYEAQERKINDEADLYISRIQSARQSALNRIGHSVDFFQNKLAGYLHHELGANPGKEKSVTLAHGRIGKRAQEPEIVRNEESLMQWLIENNLAEFIKSKTTESINWKALKAALDFTSSDHAVFARNEAFDPYGEEIEAITVVPLPDMFYYTFQDGGETLLTESGQPDTLVVDMHRELSGDAGV